jgi:hypothetical protein
MGWVLKYSTHLFGMFTALITTLPSPAQIQAEQQIDTVVVQSQRHTSAMRGELSKTLVWDMELMETLPQILSNADPLRYARMLPGIQSNIDMDAGLHIQGCDDGHNLVSLHQVPVYNPAHLFGFFSVFNSAHYSSMRLSQTTHQASDANYLGGFLDMQLPEEHPDSVNGVFTMGLISSQGTLRIPLSTKWSVNISSRMAYLNMLYSRWLRDDNNTIGYGFNDHNITFLYTPTQQDKFLINFYIGQDKITDEAKDYLCNLSEKWGNEMGALHWEHRFRQQQILRQNLFVTHYKNAFHLDQEQLLISLPSYITTYGYKNTFSSPRMEAGIDLAYHIVQPQNPEVKTESYEQHTSPSIQRAQEYNLFGQYHWISTERWGFETGLRSTIYKNPDSRWLAYFDPQAELSYRPSSTACIRWNAAIKHQYIFQTGFSSLGLPIEFKMLSNNTYKPQREHALSLSYEQRLRSNRWSLSMEVYYKELYHQVDYRNTIMDLYYSAYNLSEQLLTGRGRSYGANIMLHKRTGRLTGWLSYSYGRSWRYYDHPDYPSRYPASHERPHEINAVFAYKANNRWSFCATFIYATGTPFTATTYFYLINGRIISQYGPYNGNRLADIFRLDLSSNYIFLKKRGREHSVNFSLYNATNSSFPLSYRLRFSNRDFAYRPYKILSMPLPSISYSIKF